MAKLDVPSQLVRQWLHHGLSGCLFSAALAKVSGSLVFHQVPGNPSELDLTGTLPATLDDAARDGLATIVIFPDLKSAAEVAQIVARLRGIARWTVIVRPPTGAKYEVLLKWKTRGDTPSYAMGFGPIAEMPATRRAPFIGMALWSGGHKNVNHPAQGKTRSIVTLSDTPNSFQKADHDTIWDQSEKLTKEYLRGEFDAKELIKITFILPSSTHELALKS